MPLSVVQDFAGISNTGWIVLFGIATFLFIIFITVGIRVKFGDKEISIGGILRILANRDVDGELSRELKKLTDQIDADMSADLAKVIEFVEEKLLDLITPEGCEFPFGRLASIIKSELYNRKNYNDLKSRLSAKNWNRYRDEIFKDIQLRYELFHTKTNTVPCGIQYPRWSDIKSGVIGILEWWKESSKNILKIRKQEKVALYNQYAPKFRTEKERNRCCISRRDANLEYIKMMEA